MREETQPPRLMEREEGNQQGVVSESQEERVRKEGAGNGVKCHRGSSSTRTGS